VDEDDVRHILPDGGDPDVGLVQFIYMAHIITNALDDCATDLGVTLTHDQLWLIETNYAAYLYVDRDQSHYRSKKTMDAAASFGEKANYPYFDTIKHLLGPLGLLDCLERRSEAIDIAWLGLPPSDQTDYVDRD